MSIFSLGFTTNTDAFGDDDRLEIERILRRLADDVRDGVDFSTAPVIIRDHNGNTIGRARETR